MTAIAGYFLAAAHFGFSWTSFVGVTAGVALIIASACVVNNITDRDLDARMDRTKTRDVAAGKIPLWAAAGYSLALGAAGLYLLVVWTNLLTAELGVLAYVWYVLIYAIAKRTTPLSTIIGAVCGALPPVAGYTALANNLDSTAWILFGLLMVWQLPHFYAIAIFRRGDYEKAGLPVWSVRFSNLSTKKQIFFWVVIYALIAPLPTLYKSTGIVYLVVMLTVSLYWIYQGARYYRKATDEKWAKRMFGVSLVALLVLSCSLALGGYLP
jgi:protoheme IX farnesyltransferase